LYIKQVTKWNFYKNSNFYNFDVLIGLQESEIGFMQIFPMNKYKSSIYLTEKIAFSSTRKHTLTNNGQEYCNYTNMNRGDVDWQKFILFIDEKYKNQEKVKINCFGCSDGSEPYTLAIHLINQLGADNAQKFLPIDAFDLSENLIKEAIEGKILLHNKDIDFIKKNNVSKFFKRDYTRQIQNMRNIDFYPFVISDELRKCVNFSVGDINTKAKEQNFSNKIILFRNGWTFNDLKAQNMLAKNLFNSSNENTTILIGQSDLFKSSASDFLQLSGFKGLNSDIFTGTESDYPSESIGQPIIGNVFQQYILFCKTKNK